ncbi:uncharacterized protein FTOL_13238 [Fusarium torulosum]|uniref:Peptidase S9 prolyl oligopeptidase catalytic domain-containing protein n=1 Tax=Fusarium torulosum TaxID=33205 RepID=A0AAE8MLR2_9HYPO|nr:uncharacterized protein FTOL_13238 [Fusarium torulosum]
MLHHKGFIIALLFACTQALDPGQASNFEISPQVAEEHGCYQNCQGILTKTSASDLEIFGTQFDFDFYDTAANFSGSKPGDVLKLKPVDSSTLSVPPGVAVYKMQYTSVDLDGSLVPSTGFIAFPFAQTPKPFDLVAYAHGTSGVFRGCAPSTSPNLFDYQSWTPLVVAGYAVVATDYAGLGNNYTAHKYIASAANANDVYYSVRAAQTAFPGRLSRQWASIGHSQGGGAAWKLSEHKLVQGAKSGYLGGVAVAPVTKLHDELEAGLEKLKAVKNIHDYYILGVIPSSAIAIKAVFPDYKAPLLSDKMKKRIDLARIGQLCDVATSGLTHDLSLDEMFKNTDTAADSRMEEFQKLNSPAQGDSASKPLLVIQGAEDTIVFQNASIAAFDESCKHGNHIRLSLYPGLDHTASMTAASPEWLEFIADLFADRHFPRRCSKMTIKPFDLEHAKAPLDSV